MRDIEKARDAIKAGIAKTLVKSESGYDDFDVQGAKPVHRVCIPHNIKLRQIFNAYLDGFKKIGVEWTGSVEGSLAKFLEASIRNH